MAEDKRKFINWRKYSETQKFVIPSERNEIIKWARTAWTGFSESSRVLIAIENMSTARFSREDDQGIEILTDEIALWQIMTRSGLLYNVGYSAKMNTLVISADLTGIIGDAIIKT